MVTGKALSGYRFGNFCSLGRVGVGGEGRPVKDKTNTFPSMCRPLAPDCDWFSQ